MKPSPTKLLACLVLALPAAAQEAAPPEPKARTTVLHLEGGQVLRAPARERDGQWEVRVKNVWTTLPAGAVLRARTERELLDQAAKLERGLPRDDLVRRVAYAEWLGDEGLRVECLKQLDRVLDADPDQKDALALLERANLPLALAAVPESEAGLEAYFAANARLTGAARELAVQRLAAADEIPGLRASLAKELLSRTTGRRAFAALVLRRMFPGSEAQGLVSRAVLDSAPEVRTSAALGLRAFEDPSVILPALRAMDSKHAAVRANAIEALGTMEYREAVAPLFTHLVALQQGGSRAPHTYIFNGTQKAYVQDFDVEVASGQAIADPIINVLTEGSVLDVAVIGVSEYQLASEGAAVRRALTRLTGANPGATTVAWQRWWKEHGDEWQAGASPTKAPSTPAGQG